MKILLLTISILLGTAITADAQQINNTIIHLPFDGNLEGKENRLIADWIYGNLDFDQGVAGKALNLSASSPSRKRVIVEHTDSLWGDESQNFSVQVWVRSLPDSRNNYAILSTKAGNADQDTGWAVAATPFGSWKWNIGDGEHAYRYTPTAERQPINDGNWHQLAFTIDQDRHEARIYYDGKNVAIYNMEGIKSLGQSPLHIGASAASDRSEWDTFNGWIDEVAVWDKVLTGEQIRQQYEVFRSYQPESLHQPVDGIKVMTWNIWHGGHEHGEQVGVERVIEIIRQADPDIISMQETYGSGEEIADALGYYFYLRSSNLSIMSRYPIIKTDPDLFQAFNAGAAEIQLPSGQKVAFHTIWLHYLPDYWSQVKQKGNNPDSLVAAEEETRLSEIKSILKQVRPKIERAGDVPIIMAGDFNSGSHLDWTPSAAPLHNGYVVEWPVSKAISQAGFKDVYRAIHSDPVQRPGFTWSPVFKTATQDRIDYIYYQGEKLTPVHSEIIDTHPVKFPSDHAAVTATLEIETK